MSRRVWASGLVAALLIAVFWTFFVWEVSADRARSSASLDAYFSSERTSLQEAATRACREAADPAACADRFFREERREESDLRAQQEMAAWAMGALVVGGLTLLVSAIGALAVLRSLVEARKTTEIALATLNSERAWLTPDDPLWIFESEPFEGQERPTKVGIALRFKNTGRTPAINTTVSAHFAIASADDPMPVFDPAPPSGSSRLPVVGVSGTIGSGELSIRAEDYYLGVIQGRARWYVYCIVRYGTLMGDIQGKTELCAEVVHQGFEVTEGGLREPLRGLSPVGGQNSVS